MLDEYKEEIEEFIEFKEFCCFFSCFRNLFEGLDLLVVFRELRVKFFFNVKKRLKL